MAGGGGTLAASGLNYAPVLQELGLEAPASGGVISGTDIAPVESTGIFANLIRLRNALRNNDQTEITRASEHLDEDLSRSIRIRGEVGARVQAFDTETFERLAEVKTGPVPIRVAVSPDGRWVVTSNLGSGSLTVIDAATRSPVREIRVSGSEEAQQVTILFSADGQRLYAAETGRNQVAEVEFASGKVLRRLPAGTAGDGLAIAP